MKIYLGKVPFPDVFTVCGHVEENCPSVFLNQGIHTRDFEDPAVYEGSEGEKLVKFREVRVQIKVKIQEWADQMLAQSH